MTKYSIRVFRSARIIPESEIFIRDFSQTCYQAGFSGVTKSLTQTAAYVERQIQNVNYQRVYFVGNSMGGYAAILSASLIGKAAVVSGSY